MTLVEKINWLNYKNVRFSINTFYTGIFTALIADPNGLEQFNAKTIEEIVDKVYEYGKTIRD